MPVGDVQKFHEASYRYLSIMAEVGLEGKPKDHMLIHLAARILQMGSPSFYRIWLDDGISRVLKAVAKGSHYSVLARRVLLEFPKAMSSESSEW